MPSKVYNCRVCGKPCVALDDEDAEALSDGASSWHVVHIQCAKREVRERKAREQAS